MRLTSPSSIVPRQAPCSSSAIITWAFQRCMSARTARLMWRMPRAAFSSSDPGCTSMVDLDAGEPRRELVEGDDAGVRHPSVTFHLMRSSGRCSSISALNSLDLPQIFALKVTWVSSSWLTLSRRCMNSGHASNCVHSL